MRNNTNEVIVNPLGARESCPQILEKYERKPVFPAMLEGFAITAKNITFLFFTIMMAIGLTILTPFTVRAAQDGLPTIYLSSAQGKVGDIVKVGIGIKNNPGVASMRIYVSYDDKALRLVKRAMDKGVLGAQFHSDKLASPYTLLWLNGTVKENYTVNGDIATLEFEILSNSGSDISLEYHLAQYDIHNVKLESVHFAMENGKVRVGSPTLESESINDAGDD